MIAFAGERPAATVWPSCSSLAFEGSMSRRSRPRLRRRHSDFVNDALAPPIETSRAGPPWPAGLALLLANPDADTLRRLDARPHYESDDRQFTVLNFIDADRHPFTLRCKVLQGPEAALLDGREFVEEHASRAALLT